MFDLFMICLWCKYLSTNQSISLAGLSLLQPIRIQKAWTADPHIDAMMRLLCALMRLLHAMMHLLHAMMHLLRAILSNYSVKIR